MMSAGIFVGRLVVGSLMLAGLGVRPGAMGQDQPGTVGQGFDVASVRPSRTDAVQHTNVPLDSGDVYSEISGEDARSAAGGYLVATHQPLWRYITFAYKLTGTQELALAFQHVCRGAEVGCAVLGYGLVQWGAGVV